MISSLINIDDLIIVNSERFYKIFDFYFRKDFKYNIRSVTKIIISYKYMLLKSNIYSRNPGYKDTYHERLFKTSEVERDLRYYAYNMLAEIYYHSTFFIESQSLKSFISSHLGSSSINGFDKGPVDFVFKLHYSIIQTIRHCIEHNRNVMNPTKHSSDYLLSLAKRLNIISIPPYTIDTFLTEPIILPTTVYKEYII